MTTKIPTFELTGTSTAVTFHFRVPAPLGGWATCTINDATGELLIMSDWGNWSYRWHVDHVGPSRRNPHRASLMEFVCDRADFHYLAGKLCRESDGARQFDAWATVKAMRAQLCENRLEQGRENRRPQPEDFANMEDWEAERKIEETFRWATKRRFHGLDEPLTRGIAREIWDAMDELETTDNEHVFWERVWQVPGITWVSEEPWNLAVHAPSHAYRVLLEGILPALADAAQTRVDAVTPHQPPIGWAGDLAVRQARERGVGGVL